MNRKIGFQLEAQLTIRIYGDFWTKFLMEMREFFRIDLFFVSFYAESRKGVV